MNNPCSECICKDSSQCPCNKLEVYEAMCEAYNQALKDLENRYVELVEAEYGKFAYKDGLVSRAIRSLKK